MTLSHPSKIGLGEQIQGSLAMLKRTLYTMDKTVDKAEQDPERYHVTIRELHQRCATPLPCKSHDFLPHNEMKSAAPTCTYLHLPALRRAVNPG